MIKYLKSLSSIAVLISATTGAVPITTLPGNIGPSVGGNPGVMVPARPLPLWVGPKKVHSDMQLLLIDDQVANNQYISTLISKGTILPGGQPAAIFGSRQRMGANHKPLIWYPHAVDRKIPVQEVFSAQPAFAFAGAADRRGSLIGFSQGAAQVPSGEHVNIGLSDMAFSRFMSAGLGSSNTLTYKQRLQDGSEREISATVRKAATITLQKPTAAQCREETVNGLVGKICIIRSVSVKQNAANPGDLRFIARAKGETPVSQFRVAQRWHDLGESISVAELVNSQAIEVFIKKEALGTEPLINRANSLEMGFYSPSRLGLGDRFNIKIAPNLQRPHDKDPQFSRLELLLVNDQVANNQYVTTLSSSTEQTIYGVRTPQSFGGGSRPAAWYLQKNTPIKKTTSQSLALPVLTPAKIFDGFVNDLGLSDGNAANPRLSSGGLDQFSKMNVGDTTTLSYGSTRNAGLLRSHIVKGAEINLSPATTEACTAETVNNIAGQVCVLRQVNAKVVSSSGGDIQFKLMAPLASPDTRVRVDGKNWYQIGEAIPIAKFTKSKSIDIFKPENKLIKKDLKYKLLFYSAGQFVRGDRYLIDVLGYNTGVLEYHNVINNIAGNKMIAGSLTPEYTINLVKPTESENEKLAVSIVKTDDPIHMDTSQASIYFNGTYSETTNLSIAKALLLPKGTKVIKIQMPGRCNVSSAFTIRMNASLSDTTTVAGFVDYPAACGTGGGGGGEVPVAVKSISDAQGKGGKPLSFVVDLDRGAQAGKKLYVKFATGTAEWSHFSDTDVNVTFDQGAAIPAYSFASGNTVDLPVGAKKITLSVKTKPVDNDKQFTVGVDVGTSFGSGKKVGIGTITYDPAQVTNISSPSVAGGQRANFVVDLDKGADAGRKLYVKFATGTAGWNYFSDTDVNVTFDQGAAIPAYNFASGNTVDLPVGAKKITLSVKTKPVDKDKQFTVGVDVGTSLGSGEKVGTGTILYMPEKVELSITPLGANSVAGVIGKVDAKLHYKVNVNVANYTGGKRKKQLLARTLRTNSTIIAMLGSKQPKLMNEKSDACLLIIDNGIYKGKHVQIPAYLEFLEPTGVKKIFHGCRNEAIDISGGVWNWNQNEEDYSLRGELELNLGFVMNDPDSGYLLESPMQKWDGSAQAEGFITVKVQWNAESPAKLSR